MLCLDLSRASVESSQCSPADCFAIFYLTHLTRGDNLICSEVRRASAPSTNWIPTWSVLMFLVCFAWFFVLTPVLNFSGPLSKEGCWIRQLEGFVETQHLQAFRIHLCLSSASHSSLKDHERLAIACSRFCPIFVLPRSRVRLKWVKVSLMTPLAFVCHLRGQSWRNASVFLDFYAMRDQPYHAPGITGWGLYSKYLQWLPEMPRCS